MGLIVGGVVGSPSTLFMNDKNMGTNVDCSVYQLHFSGGKSYVGMTTNLIRRMKAHASNTKKSVVGCAWKKYGTPAISVLFQGTVEQCKQEEIRCIKEMDTRYPIGYNLTDGGDGRFGRGW